MDEELSIQLIDVLYSTLVFATPSPENDADIRGGYGSMCVWQPWQRLAAYKSMKGWLDHTIAEMELDA